MTEDLIVVGAGGFGREVIDVVDAINAAAATPIWSVAGVLDDSPSQINLQRLEGRRIRHLGGVDDHLVTTDISKFVIGIGSPQVRRQVAAKLESAGWTAATLVHPASTLGSDVRVGAGTVICAGVRVTTNVAIGRHVHLNPNVTIGHDTKVGDFVSMNPASSVSGDCVIEDDALVGVGAVVLNQLRVGRGAVVGGSACVVREVAPGAIVKGVPAR